MFPGMSGMLDGISVDQRNYCTAENAGSYKRRVLSVNSIFIMSSNEMGQFESG
jgi:hypothetical protein